MKDVLKKIAPLFLLCIYSLIAGGSLEDIGITIGITAGVLIVLGIIIAIVVSVNNSKTRKEGLAKAKDQFGDYTQEIEYELGKYILYDEPTHRILLKDSIVDSTKLADLRITERAPKTNVTYSEEQVTKTSTGSVVGRGVAGALIAGPVGAVIGGATAKKKTETKKNPEYHTIPGLYTIEVIDVNDNSRAKFSTHDEGYHYAVKSFLQNIIDENTKDEKLALQQAQENERLALQQAQEENLQRILAADSNCVILGGNADAIKDLLINSSVVERSNSNQYILSKDAIGVINRGWNSSFDTIQVTIRDHIISKINAISFAFTAGTFKNMLLEMSMLAQIIGESNGEPKLISSNISYTSLTDDNNIINAYSWTNQGESETKIDVICDKGKYKYLFTSEKR